MSTEPPPAPSRDRRRLLSRGWSRLALERVHAIPGGLELERVSLFRIERRRVLFREAFLVTLHRTTARPLAAAAGALAASSAGLAAFLLAGPSPLPGLLAGGMAALAATAAGFGAARRLEAITIVTRRARTQVVFPASSGHAREVYDRICASVREARADGPEPGAVE